MLEFGAKTPWDGDMLQAEHSESIGNWKVASGKIRILIEFDRKSDFFLSLCRKKLYF